MNGSGFGDSVAAQGETPITGPFPAMLGNYHDNVFDGVWQRQWEWRRVRRKITNTSQDAATTSNSYGNWAFVYDPKTPDDVFSPSLQSDQTNNSNPNTPIHCPAVESNNNIYLAPGQVVWLTPGNVISVDDNDPSSVSQEYTFEQPAVVNMVQGKLINALNGDYSGVMAYLLPDGSWSNGDIAPHYWKMTPQFLNPHGLYGNIGDTCTFRKNDQPTATAYPWVLLAIQQYPAFVLDNVTFDASVGYFHAQVVQITSNGPGLNIAIFPLDTGDVVWAQTTDSGTDDQRDATTCGAPVVSGSTYGDSGFTISATVSHTSGSADPSGTVSFYVGSGGNPIYLIGTSGALSGGTGTLSATDGTWNVSPGVVPASGDIYAFYNGDSSYQQSQSSGTSYTLTAANTTTTLTCNETSPSTYGDVLLFTVVVAVPSGNNGIVSGTVQILDGSTVLTTLAIPRSPFSGTVNYSWQQLHVGNRALSAVFTPTDSTLLNTSTGTLTQQINKCHLTVTANDQSMTYGGTVPALTTTITGWPINQLTLYAGSPLDPPTVITGSFNVTSTGSSSTAAGTYPITPTLGTATADDYDFPTANFVAGTLTINQASLAITAQDVSVPAGSDTPAFPVSITGVVNNDNIKAEVQDPHADMDNPGSWVLNVMQPAGGTNVTSYIITYNAGTLTVY